MPQESKKDVYTNLDVKGSVTLGTSGTITSGDNCAVTGDAVNTKLAGYVPTGRTINGYNLTANRTLDGADIKITGYSKPGSTSPLAAADTINAALGKLETALDGKQASGNYAASASDGGSASSIAATKATTTKAYLLGTTLTANGNTTPVFDTGVYLDTTAGKLTATTFAGGAALTGTPTAPTATAGTNNTQIATTAFVKTATDNLKSEIGTPMHYKGAWTSNNSLPSSPATGDTYRATVDGSVQDVATWKAGDTLVYGASAWDVIPSGDEPTGTVTHSGSVTSGHIAVFDGTTGDVIKDGGATSQFQPAGSYAPTFTVETTGSGNAVTAISYANNKITATKGATYNNYSLPLAASGTRGGVQIGYSESGTNYAVKLSSEKMYVTVPWTDTKVTAVGNHYAPATDSSAALSASASGATAAWSIDVVKGVTLSRDAKGHVTGVSVTSGKIPANPNTDTKVAQILKNDDYNRPLLMSDQIITTTTESVTGEARRNNSIYANTYTGILTAPSFKGFLRGGNNKQFSFGGISSFQVTTVSGGDTVTLNQTNNNWWRICSVTKDQYIANNRSWHVKFHVVCVNSANTRYTSDNHSTSISCNYAYRHEFLVELDMAKTGTNMRIKNNTDINEGSGIYSIRALTPKNDSYGPQIELFKYYNATTDSSSNTFKSSGTDCQVYITVLEDDIGLTWENNANNKPTTTSYNSSYWNSTQQNVGQYNHDFVTHTLRANITGNADGRVFDTVMNDRYYAGATAAWYHKNSSNVVTQYAVVNTRPIGTGSDGKVYHLSTPEKVFALPFTGGRSGSNYGLNNNAVAVYQLARGIANTELTNTNVANTANLSASTTYTGTGTAYAYNWVFRTHTSSTQWTDATTLTIGKNMYICGNLDSSGNFKPYYTSATGQTVTVPNGQGGFTANTNVTMQKYTFYITQNPTYTANYNTFLFFAKADRETGRFSYWTYGATAYTYNSSGKLTHIDGKAIQDTTYSSQTAASGGTALSLVTTGEKYTWNNKSNLAIGTTATTAAAGNHTHSISLAGDSGSSSITLAHSTIYKLTAGGSSVIFKMPASGNTDIKVKQTSLPDANVSYPILSSDHNTGNISSGSSYSSVYSTNCYIKGGELYSGGQKVLTALDLDYPVDSVNGYTGAVVLTASDIIGYTPLRSAFTVIPTGGQTPATYNILFGDTTAGVGVEPPDHAFYRSTCRLEVSKPGSTEDVNFVVPKINNYVLGNACSHTVESTVANDSNLPTGAAVKAFVEGKGYLTSHQTIKQDGITGATVTRYASCTTAAGTAAKTATITTGTLTLETGARVTVRFSNKNTASNPTLNIYNGSTATGAKNIYHNGARITTGTNKGMLYGACDFVYDGTQWLLVGNYVNNTYTVNNGTLTLKTAGGTTLGTFTANSSTSPTITLPNGTLQVQNASVSFWSDSTYPSYPYRASITVTGATANSFADVVFSDEQAKSGIYAPFCVTTTDVVHIYARSNPGIQTIPTVSVGFDNSALTVDATPTSGSTNAVTSGGVYDALNWTNVSLVNPNLSGITITKLDNNDASYQMSICRNLAVIKLAIRIKGTYSGTTGWVPIFNYPSPYNASKFFPPYMIYIPRVTYNSSDAYTSIGYDSIHQGYKIYLSNGEYINHEMRTTYAIPVVDGGI